VIGNILASMPAFSTLASHHQFLHLKLWSDEVKSHPQVRVTTPGGPVVCCEGHTFALWQLDSQLLVNSCLAIGVQKWHFVSKKI
jgi:hypothetical protein